MRGYPLINFLLALAALVALAAPLSSLSQDKEPMSATAEDVRAAETMGSTVVVKLAHPATEASLWVNGTQLQAWAPGQPSAELTAKLPLPQVAHVTEFEIRLTWPPGTPNTVAEVTVEPEGLEARTQNVWGMGHAEEVLTFSWK